jgi:phospholipase/lecithinase/hemolysin
VILRPLHALAALLLALPLPAQQLDFSHGVCFGDSLTHNDILGLVYGNPQNMYGADPFEALFAKAAPVQSTLNRYAVAGARSSHIDLQIDTYEWAELLGLAPTATLFQLEIGANDFFRNELLLAAYPPGANAQADRVVDLLLNRIEGALKRLRKRKGVEIILWTIPDLTLTPRYWALSAQQKRNLRLHLLRANQRILAYAGRPRIAVLDFMTLHQIVAADPPVIFGTQLTPAPQWGEYDFLHSDEVHPTAVSNGLIANALIQLLNGKYGVNIPYFSEQELADLAHL